MNSVKRLNERYFEITKIVDGERVIDTHVSEKSYNDYNEVQNMFGFPSKTFEQFVEITLESRRDELEKIKQVNAVYMSRFENAGLMKYWEGAYHPLTEQEILKDGDLVLEFDGVLKFNRGAIMRLAHLIRRREAASMKIAITHAWFWARVQKRDYVGSIRNGIGQHRVSLITTALDRMRNDKTPYANDISYTRENSKHRARMKVWEDLIVEGKKTAPKNITKHWCLNIGNKFIHKKHGECEIERHSNLKDGWYMFYVKLSDGKKFKMPLDSFKASVSKTKIKMTYSHNPICLTSAGLRPVFKPIH